MKRNAKRYLTVGLVVAMVVAMLVGSASATNTNTRLTAEQKEIRNSKVAATLADLTVEAKELAGDMEGYDNRSADSAVSCLEVAREQVWHNHSALIIYLLKEASYNLTRIGSDTNIAEECAVKAAKIARELVDCAKELNSHTDSEEYDLQYIERYAKVAELYATDRTKQTDTTADYSDYLPVDGKSVPLDEIDAITGLVDLFFNGGQFYGITINKGHVVKCNGTQYTSTNNTAASFYCDPKNLTVDEIDGLTGFLDIVFNGGQYYGITVRDGKGVKCNGTQYTIGSLNFTEPDTAGNQYWWITTKDGKRYDLPMNFNPDTIPQAAWSPADSNNVSHTLAFTINADGNVNFRQA